MRNIASVFSVLIGMILFSSCEKPPGPGGNGTISGKLILERYDPQFRVLQSSEPAKDKDVFIIYGDNSGYSDDVTTSYNGSFEFNYLTKGKYTIFFYSADKDNPAVEDENIIINEVTLNKNDEKADLGEIVVYERMDIDDGYASIKGRIRQVNYSNDFVFIKDTTNAQELDVYLVYETDAGYTERTRTMHDGTFAFNHLIKGNYKVIVYSEDTRGGTADIPVIQETRIENVIQEIDLGISYINIED